MFQVKQVKLLTSSVSKDNWPPDNLPEICLVGRSNVGKSSFLNALFNHKIARISSSPGKTQTLNFYQINDELMNFVDVPGYGFAIVSNTKKEQFQIMMDEYFQNRQNLKAVFLLLDHRHPPTVQDLAMLNYLQHLHIQIHLILTKADKVTQSQAHKLQISILQKLELDPKLKMYKISSVDKKGFDNIATLVDSIIK